MMPPESFYFYPTLLAYCLMYYLAAGLAINVAYHRCLSHRSFQLWKPLKYVFVTLGLPAGTPIQWVGNHRCHHANADHPRDPHSPVQDGFWYAHAGWYIGIRNPFLCFLYSVAGPLRTLYDGWHRPRSNRENDQLAGDIAADDYFRFISRPIPFALGCFIHTGLFFGIAFFIWGWAGLTLLWLSLAIIYNFGEAIDSIAHLYGERPFPATNFARNNKILGVLTLGEGWHANHHAFSSSAKHGLFTGQIDAAWLMIRILERLGVVSNVKVPTREVIEARMRSSAHEAGN